MSDEQEIIEHEKAFLFGLTGQEKYISPLTSFNGGIAESMEEALRVHFRPDCSETFTKYKEILNRLMTPVKHKEPITIEEDETFYEGGFVAKDGDGNPIAYFGPDAMRAISEFKP